MSLGTTYIIKGTNEETIEIISVMGEEIIDITTKDGNFSASIDYYADDLFKQIKERSSHIFKFDYANSWDDYTRGCIERNGNLLKIQLESQNDQINTEIIISEFIEPN